MAVCAVMTPGDGEKDVKHSRMAETERTLLSLLLWFASETNTSHDMPLGTVFDIELLEGVSLLAIWDDGVDDSDNDDDDVSTSSLIML